MLRKRFHCALGGDGGESNRPATNLPLGPVESNQVYRMVKKSGLGVKNRGADFMGASGWSRVGIYRERGLAVLVTLCQSSLLRDQSVLLSTAAAIL